MTAPASREGRTYWGFPGYQPFAGAVIVGKALRFATLLPQTWCFHCSPRSDTPSLDCLALTHPLVLVEAGGGGSLRSSRDWSRFDKAPVSFAPAGAAVPGAAERSGAAVPGAAERSGAAVPRAAERGGGAGRWSGAARRRPPRGSRRTSRNPHCQSPPLPSS